jgi:hypothetical protein
LLTYFTRQDQIIPELKLIENQAKQRTFTLPIIFCKIPDYIPKPKVKRFMLRAIKIKDPAQLEIEQLSEQLYSIIAEPKPINDPINTITSLLTKILSFSQRYERKEDIKNALAKTYYGETYLGSSSCKDTELPFQESNIIQLLIRHKKHPQLLSLIVNSPLVIELFSNFNNKYLTSFYFATRWNPELAITILKKTTPSHAKNLCESWWQDHREFSLLYFLIKDSQFQSALDLIHHLGPYATTLYHERSFDPEHIDSHVKCYRKSKIHHNSQHEAYSELGIKLDIIFGDLWHLSCFSKPEKIDDQIYTYFNTYFQHHHIPRIVNDIMVAFNYDNNHHVTKKLPIIFDALFGIIKNSTSVTTPVNTDIAEMLFTYLKRNDIPSTEKDVTWIKELLTLVMQMSFDRSYQYHTLFTFGTCARLWISDFKNEWDKICSARKERHLKKLSVLRHNDNPSRPVNQFFSELEIKINEFFPVTQTADSNPKKVEELTEKGRRFEIGNFFQFSHYLKPQASRDVSPNHLAQNLISQLSQQTEDQEIEMESTRDKKQTGFN